jgi:MFS family permease
MPSATDREPLFTREFIGLCLVIFLSYCNISVFYSLYLHLAALGIPESWRGFLIGCSSLTMVLLFAVATPFISVKNAARNMVVGVAILAVCGGGYLLARDVTSMLFIRLAHGAALFLLTSSCMTLLVAIIPPTRSGQAFGVYSASMLIPFSLVPLLCDTLKPWLTSPDKDYALMALLLVPAALVARRLGRAVHARTAGEPATPPMSFRGMLAGAARAPVSVLLGINAVYYVVFAAVFYLAKGLFEARGLSGVGAFFTLQTALMIAVRVLGNRLFDVAPKVVLVRLCYLLTGLGLAVAWGWRGQTGMLASAVVLGLGMGLGVPALNAYMFSLSDARTRAVNANLMILSLQSGNFLGPILGAATVEALGYDRFLVVMTGVCAAALLAALRFKEARG